MEPVTAIPKPSREVDTEWIAWLKKREEWECLIHGKACEEWDKAPPDPCHVVSRGAGGSDRLVLPLCRMQHRLFDTDVSWTYRNKGVVAEWIWLLSELYREYKEDAQ